MVADFAAVLRIFVIALLFVLSACGGNGGFAPAVNPENAGYGLPAPLFNDAGTFFDVTGWNPFETVPVIYRDYGWLYLTEGHWENEITPKPWSAWWYPLRDKSLFHSKTTDLSPLQKYDSFVRAVYHTESEATKFEEEKIFNAKAQQWEGHCHAWAIASILIPEPKETITKAEISFNVVDQKALIIKSYEEFSANYYGQRYRPSSATAWSNIQPHFFHQFVMKELIEKGRPFVMNKVPGLEVWNVPVWKAVIDVKRDQNKPSVFHVATALVTTAALNEPIEAETLIGTNEVNVYTYDLFTVLDPKGGDLVIAGNWTEISKDLHPSILIKIDKQEIPHRSRNAEIKNAILRELLIGFK
ncbi:MAG: hypothetical protein A3K03_03810 [Bdellovibrionales bacterium RIFOXYD1_FULL_44_7]|nr:MAG: hypothetical protein A3K03_03810 [Bdellovibrionales bacterium RIFOXYD1_FULL_44_7]